MEFDWNAANAGHIARHGITPQEAEEAVRIEPLDADVQQHDDEARVLCFGRTKSGRLLAVIYHRAAGQNTRCHRVRNDKTAAATLFWKEMSVPKERIAIPKFKTEAEEAAWWDSHPEIAAEIMKQALKSGAARRKVPLKTVTMRLPMADLATAQDLASRKGLPYQTYIKMVLHEALQEKRRSA